jgi:hypothetical protein
MAVVGCGVEQVSRFSSLAEVLLARFPNRLRDVTIFTSVFSLYNAMSFGMDLDPDLEQLCLRILQILVPVSAT